jgi:hypothetical protein
MRLVAAEDSVRISSIDAKSPLLPQRGTGMQLDVLDHKVDQNQEDEVRQTQDVQEKDSSICVRIFIFVRICQVGKSSNISG